MARPSTPWYLWASVLGVTSAAIGLHWDISWHRSIGRDTFWTPPHMAIYLCGVIAGVSSAYLILGATLGKLPEVRKYSVKMWEFHAPLGAFMTAWGGVTMLVSAPFDNWWHSAYGLDVKILSPPHMVLAAGIVGIAVGALMLVAGYMNRAQAGEQRLFRWLFLYLGAMILVLSQLMTLEYTFRVAQHTATFYIAVAISAPTALAGIAHGSGHRWGATIIAAGYTLVNASLIWILPLFPAQPKLGPVYTPITHFVPASFPLLLLVPAIAIDLLRRKIGAWNVWLQAAISGAAFEAVFMAVQWPFANFLVSQAAANRFFGTIYRDFGTRPQSLEVRGIFLRAEPDFATLMTIAFAVAILTTGIGLARGNWIRTVKR